MYVEELERHLEWVNSMSRRMSDVFQNSCNLPLLSLSFAPADLKIEPGIRLKPCSNANEAKGGMNYWVLSQVFGSSELPSHDHIFDQILMKLDDIGFKPSQPCTVSGLASGYVEEHINLCKMLEFAVIDHSLSVDMLLGDLRRLPKSFYVLRTRMMMLDEVVCLWLSKYHCDPSIPPIKDLASDLRDGLAVCSILSKAYPSLISKEQIRYDTSNAEAVTSNWDNIRRIADKIGMYMPSSFNAPSRLLLLFVCELYYATRSSTKKFIEAACKNEDGRPVLTFSSLEIDSVHPHTSLNIRNNLNEVVEIRQGGQTSPPLHQKRMLLHEKDHYGDSEEQEEDRDFSFARAEFQKLLSDFKTDTDDLSLDEKTTIVTILEKLYYSDTSEQKMSVFESMLHDIVSSPASEEKILKIVADILRELLKSEYFWPFAYKMLGISEIPTPVPNPNIPHPTPEHISIGFDESESEHAIIKTQTASPTDVSSFADAFDSVANSIAEESLAEKSTSEYSKPNSSDIDAYLRMGESSFSDDYSPIRPLFTSETMMLTRTLNKQAQVIPNHLNIVNALRFNLLIGRRFQHQLEAILETLSEYESERILLLLASRTGVLKGIYVLSQDCTTANKIYGQGPMSVQESECCVFLKFDSASKVFTPLPSKSFTQTSDAFSLKPDLEPQGW